MRSATAADAQAICSSHSHFAFQFIFTFEEAGIRSGGKGNASLAGLALAAQP